MRPTTVVADDTTPNSAPIVTDYLVAPANIALGVVVNGVVNYTVQHTFDDPFKSTGLTGATWYNHPTLNAQTANADGNYMAPPRAVRIIRNSGTGSATLTLVQTGPAT